MCWELGGGGGRGVCVGSGELGVKEAEIQCVKNWVSSIPGTKCTSLSEGSKHQEL